MRHVFSTAAAFLVAAFMIFAGISKLVFYEEFEAVLKDWLILPQWGLPMIIIGVPFLEIMLGLWLVSSRSDWRPRVFLIALLCVFTVTVLIENSYSGNVSCGCLGQAMDTPTNIGLLVLRNMGLCLALVFHPSLFTKLGRYAQSKRIRIHAD